MTRLGRLSVSLTKHGAHKIALLLRKYDASRILDHLENSEPGINIEFAQAKKNLAVSSNGIVPEVWNEARRLGPEAINALVLIAIIFSHSHLIEVLKNSENREGFSGTIKRSRMQNGKAFTNFAHTIDELGYANEHSPDHVRYDFCKLFDIAGLNVLAEKLLSLKLVEAGWDQKNSLSDEAIRLGLYEVFSLSAAEFSSWLKGEVRGKARPSASDTEDAQFFFGANDGLSSGQFQFKPGHRPKKIGTITTNLPPERRAAVLLHNDIQTRLYQRLCARFGPECVGTEVPTGDGTSIDIVVKTKDFCWFYEIKTDSAVKGCIRQAIPQLLEYAYWQCDHNRADKLIITSPAAITPEAQRYLSFLRKSFKLRLYYEQVKA